MKRRISNPLIAALVALTAISSLTLIGSPSGAIRTYIDHGDRACEVTPARGLTMYAVIAWGAAEAGLRCPDLRNGSGIPYGPAGYCHDDGAEICSHSDVNVIQLKDLENVGTLSDCLRPYYSNYQVRSDCYFYE